MSRIEVVDKAEEVSELAEAIGRDAEEAEVAFLAGLPEGLSPGQKSLLGAVYKRGYYDGGNASLRFFRALATSSVVPGGEA